MEIRATDFLTDLMPPPNPIPDAGAPSSAAPPPGDSGAPDVGSLVPPPGAGPAEVPTPAGVASPGTGGGPTDAKSKAAEYARAYRERQKAKAANQKGAKPAPAAGKTPGPDASGKPADASAPKMPAGHVRKIEDALTGALGTALTVTVAVAVSPKAPRPSEDVIREAMKPWAHIVAPHIDPADTGSVATLVAAGVSLAHLGAYAVTLHDWTKANPAECRWNRKPDAQAA